MTQCSSLQKLKEELKDLQDVHDETKKKLRKTKNELADAVLMYNFSNSLLHKLYDEMLLYNVKCNTF